MMPAYEAYAPLNTLKPFAENVWIVDGPEIAMHYLGMTLPFPTRMTIVRLRSGELWVHSPIAWDDSLALDIARLGPVAWLVAPNTLHYEYLPEWQRRFPAARSFGPAALANSKRHAMRIDEALTATPPECWESQFDLCLVPGTILTEVDFFHCASKTLIITDLIENFEKGRVRRPWLRRAMQVFGAADPDGKAPYDMQLTFLGHRSEVRASVERMIAWQPERIIIAHGRCYERNGVRELERAFRWVL